MKNLEYHSGSAAYTKSIRFFLLFLSPAVIVFLLAIGMLFKDNSEMGLAGWIMYSIPLAGSFFAWGLIYWIAYYGYFVFRFVDGKLELSLYNGTKVATYAPEDLVKFYLKDRFGPLRFLTPNFYLEFIDGRKIKMSWRIENCTSMIDDIEEWSGLSIGDRKKIELRGDRSMMGG